MKLVLAVTAVAAGDGDVDVSRHDAATEAVAAALDAAGRGRAVGIHAAAAVDDADWTSDALAVAAPPGGVLLSTIAADLAAGALPPGVRIVDAGRRRLVDLGPPRPVMALTGAGVAAHEERAAGGDVEPDLPMQLRTIVGRLPVVRDIAGRVAEGRLVTAVGPGGVGKTTVAMRVAARVAARFAGAVEVVDLASLADEEAVSSAIDGAGSGERPTLLLVDCCEHVALAAADAIRRRLQAGDAVLATSRVPLGVDGEEVVGLHPLDASESVRLFDDRSRRAHPDAATEPDAAAVAELCRRLDGLPLAIELAAARSRVLSPAAITARLDERFRVLASNPAAGQDHHRSLAAAIEWSHDLLTETERLVLHRVAVFAAPFDLLAAEYVCADVVADVEVLDALDGLVAKSLVVAEPANVAPFRLLESIRAYAAARLHDDPDADQAAQAGTFRWLEAATEPFDHGDTGPREVADRRLQASAADVLTAVSRAVDDDPSLGVLLVARLGGWFLHHGRVREGLHLAGAAVERDPGTDPLSTARVLNTAANLEVTSGAADRALPLYERSVALRRAASGGNILASALNDLAVCRYHLGDLAGARVALAEATELSLAAGDRWSAATAAVNVGSILVAEDDVSSAAERFSWAIGEMDDLGDVLTAAAARTNLANVLVRLGRGDEAHGTVRRAVADLVALGDRAYLPFALDAAAAVALSADDLPRAARLWGAARHAADESGIPAPESDPGVALAGRLGRDARDLLAAEGARLPLTEVVELVGAEPAPPTPMRRPRRAATTIDTEPAPAVLAREGAVWAMTFRGRTTRVRDSRGMTYLARLLADGPREVHVLDLTGGTAHGRAGPALDEEAKAAYRRRITDLQEMIERYEARGDDAKAAAADEELSALVAELGGALGLGGRTRRPGDDVERARKAVTNRIRDTVAKIGEDDPVLGRHLAVSVRTGTFCRYEPESPVRWSVRP